MKIKADNINNCDIITDDIKAVKTLLKIAVLSAGFKDVSDYANHSTLPYSKHSIKISFNPKHKTSDKMLYSIADELNVNLKIEYKKTFFIKRNVS